VTENAIRRRVRAWLLLFVLALVLSGLTAFPLELESRLLAQYVDALGLSSHWPALAAWVSRVHRGLADTYSAYPFIAYGTDWLAFAHLAIAVAFWGPLRDPERNVWVVEFGMIACAGVLPLALVCGWFRGIPWFWQCIDMSFGVLGLVPLWLARRGISRLAAMKARTT
jgi:hypothetical protein